MALICKAFLLITHDTEWVKAQVFASKEY